MAPIAILSMAYAIRHDGHVRVDVIYNRFPPRLQHAIEVISFLMVAAVSALIVWLSIPYVMQSYTIGEGSPDPGGLPARWIPHARSEEPTSDLQSLMRRAYAGLYLN